jgi:hypothetical protein
MFHLGGGTEYALPQGVVTVNHATKVNLFSSRSSNSDSQTVPKLGSLHNANQLHINANDLLWSEVPMRSRNTKSSQITRPPVFSSFTGETIGDSATDGAFRRRFRFRGVSQIPWRFNDPNQSQSGVSAVVRGKLSIFNLGETHFMQGDLVQANLPPIGESERNLLWAKFSTVPGVNDKFTAYLTRADGSEYFRKLVQDLYTQPDPNANAYEAEAVFNAAVTPDSLGTKDVMSEKDTFFYQFCINLTRAAALATLSTFAELGVIKLMNPSNAGVPLPTWESSWWSGIVGPNPPGNLHALGPIAHLLGVYKYPNFNILKNEQETKTAVVEALVSRTFNGIIPPNAKRSRYGYARQMLDMAGQAISPEDTDLLNACQKFIDNASVEALVQTEEIQGLLGDSAIGVAAGNAKPGQLLPIQL